MTTILLLNGPNLNLLGQREPSVYGTQTLADIIQGATAVAAQGGAVLHDFQSNSETELIERVQATLTDGTDFIIVNPGAFTHTSVALRDAFLSAGRPFVEVHLSNIFSRETFRHHSYLSDIAKGVISGLGALGYEAAVRFALDYAGKES